jgi:threonyl-tRNA synthetase
LRAKLLREPKASEAKYIILIYPKGQFVYPNYSKYLTTKHYKKWVDVSTPDFIFLIRHVIVEKHYSHYA